jgi:ABC-2 type transport system permease protein
MNLALYRHSWRSQRIRLTVVSAALLIWGFLLPVIYAQFGSQFRVLLESGLIPAQVAQFGGGDVFSLPGSIALGLVHPIAMILTSIFAVGFSSFAIAGERQRGYLEVVLARPISRRALYGTLAAAAFSFVALSVTALLTGGLAGSTLAGVIGELAIVHVPLLWLNAFLLFASFAAIGLAASVSFDRLPPALGVTIGIVVTMYTIDVVGSLWPRAEFLQPYSLFHYLKARAILTGAAEPRDLVVLAAVIGAAIGWAIIVFPRRNLAAPS